MSLYAIKKEATGPRHERSSICACRSGRASAGGTLPLETTVAPSWTVTVVDENGNAVKGAVVREAWQNYSFEGEGHEESAQTDDIGAVTFPRRSIKASIGKRVLGSIVNIITLGVHASFGPHALILAWAQDADGAADYIPSEPLPQEIVLHRRKD